MAEEKTKEQIEKMEGARDQALKNISGSYWDYALPKLVTSAQYGNLSELAELGYSEMVSNSPSQEVYEQLFLPQLTSEGGAITSPYLQMQSLKIIQESLLRLKVDDFANYLGIKDIKEDFKGKYISEIDKKDAGLMIGSYIQNKTDDKVKELISFRQKNVSKGLEELLSEKEENPQ